MPRRARMALMGAAVGVVLLALTWYSKVHVGLVMRADRSILLGFAGLHRGGVDFFASAFAFLCDPQPYVVLVAALVVLALTRGRRRLAITIFVIILGANTTSHVFKPLLAEPHLLPLPTGLSIEPASWPSGHATAAMALALCSVIAAPARWRPRVAAVMATFAVVVSYSFLELGWHYPSDVLGGFLLAATWTLLGAGVLAMAEARWPRHTAGEAAQARPVSIGQALTPVAVMLLVALVFAGLLALARPSEVISYARAHELFIIGAAGIGALSLMLAEGAVLALRRDPPETRANRSGL